MISQAGPETVGYARIAFTKGLVLATGFHPSGITSIGVGPAPGFAMFVGQHPGVELVEPDPATNPVVSLVNSFTPAKSCGIPTTGVFPAKAGIQRSLCWIPAFAGMTHRVSNRL